MGHLEGPKIGQVGPQERPGGLQEATLSDVDGKLDEDAVFKSSGKRLGAILDCLGPVWALSWASRGGDLRAARPGLAECGDALEMPLPY